MEDDCLSEAQGHVSFCMSVWPYRATTSWRPGVARLAGDYPQAEARLDECKRLEKEATQETHLEALLKRAENGEVDDLEDDLVRAANRDQRDAALIYESLGRGELNLQHYGRALFYLDASLKRRPDNVRVLDRRGLALEQAGKRKRPCGPTRRRWNSRTVARHAPPPGLALPGCFPTGRSRAVG